MNSMKRQKDMTLKDKLPRLVDAQYAIGEERRTDTRNNEETKQINAQLWMVKEVKSDALRTILHRNLEY